MGDTLLLSTPVKPSACTNSSTFFVLTPFAGAVWVTAGSARSAWVHASRKLGEK
jgi:hypothetical protein